MGRLRVLLEALEGRSTLKAYPRESVGAPQGFRGPPVFDPSRCAGCGACVVACPSNAVKLGYRDSDRVYVLEHSIGRCIFCGLCADVCPFNAISMSREFELATSNPLELVQSISHEAHMCPECGRAYATARLVNYAHLKLPASYVLECPECRARKVALTIAMSRRV